MNWPCVHASGVAERVPLPDSSPGGGWSSQTCSGSISPSLAVLAIVSQVAVCAASGDQLVLAALASEQRPQAAARLARRVVEEQVPVVAVGLLAVAVEREAVPDRTARRVDLQRIGAALPSPTSSELRIVWSFHFLTPNSTRPRNELSTISRWSTGRGRSCRPGCSACASSGPRRPWSRAGNTAWASRGRWSSRSSLDLLLPLVGERLVGARLGRPRRSCARCRRRRSARRSPSRSCWASSRPGSPSAPGRSRRARWRRGSRRPARRAPSPPRRCGPSHQASTIGSDTWSSCSVVHFSRAVDETCSATTSRRASGPPRGSRAAVGRGVVARRLLRGRHVVEVARPHEVVRAGEAAVRARASACPRSTACSAPRSTRRGRSCPPRPPARAATARRGAAASRVARTLAGGALSVAR